MMASHETVKPLASLADGLNGHYGLMDAVIPLLREYAKGTAGVQRPLGVTFRGFTYVVGVALALTTVCHPCLVDTPPESEHADHNTEYADNQLRHFCSLTRATAVGYGSGLFRSRDRATLPI